NVDGAVSWVDSCHLDPDASASLWRIGPGIKLMERSNATLPVGRWIGYAALILFAIISLGPLWVAFKTALTGPNALFGSGSSILPHDTTLFNFQRVLGFIDPHDPR